MMELYTDRQPIPERVLTLPCILLTEIETEYYIGDDHDARRRVDAQAQALAETLQPAPEIVPVFCPRGELVTTISPGYRFISSVATQVGQEEFR
jgi:hypothetical protein